MRLLKKIIALICIIAISLSCLVVPAFAVDVGGMGDLVSGVADFGQWAIDSSIYGIKLVARIFDEDVCPERPGGVNTTHSFVVNTTTKDGVLADWYVCEYCGFNSGYKADSESLSAAYDDYVATLPATGYTSTGGLLWQPTWVNVSGLYPGSYSTNFLELYTFDPSGSTLSLAYRPNSFPSGFLVTVTSFPHYGAYRVYVPFTVSYQYQGTKGTIVSKQLFSAVSSQTTRLTPSSSYDILISTTNMYPDWVSQTYTSFNFVLPIFEVIPDTVVDKNIYNINTRPTSITGGNYGIVGDNGQITKVEDNSTIINETNNTYYNPATGQTVPITGWSYDYSDRSYKVTLESGDTVTVTYGDENISITETTVNESGDTITNNYTIYYLIDGTGSENPPSACEHTWTETSTTPATCTMPGSKLFTCSKCQQTKTETLPALGHDWQVKQSVTTEYDDTGQLVQEGYIIYECSRCHEQYKAASGTSPPVNPSDPDASGEGVFSGIFGLLLDFLSFFWKTFKDFTKSGVKAFLDALKDGTSDVFGLLNPFDWSA